MKNNMPPRQPGVQPLDNCERANGNPRFGRGTRNQTVTAEDLGERNIQGILARGCKVTTVITDSGNTKVDVPYHDHGRNVDLTRSARDAISYACRSTRTEFDRAP